MPPSCTLTTRQPMGTSSTISTPVWVFAERFWTWFVNNTVSSMPTTLYPDRLNRIDGAKVFVPDGAELVLSTFVRDATWMLGRTEVVVSIAPLVVGTTSTCNRRCSPGRSSLSRQRKRLSWKYPAGDTSVNWCVGGTDSSTSTASIISRPRFSTTISYLSGWLAVLCGGRCFSRP